ncbi:Bug family tripartite tricarboxylate transporter substrate binding protein [Bordetella petrii]|uniref:Bug family tripartite tricarboxylate transporter substrate binding protein n=1 Tax=Bordetella petrii TaxID=94624 RepID=UPI001E326337|nr:tripartite tricarboxylate transporter substrate binding protein [Bordetella petrii]MCD0503023.1 tripartite tricarboxylate transporter substrate binding protein [Bordetella petrii]
MSTKRVDAGPAVSPGRRNTLLAMLAAGAGMAGLAPAVAWAGQGYPRQPVRIVVGFAAGAATDAFARVIARKLGDALGQQFIVENKPGAATRIGMDHVRNAKPDGYVLGFATAVTTAFPLLFDGVTFAPGQDFTPVAMLGRAPMYLVVRDSLPVKNYAEFVEYGKKQGNLTFAHQGVGSNPHLTGMALAHAAGIKIVPVAYKGGGPMSVALGAGEVDFGMLEYAGARAMLERGAVRLLMVTEPRRSQLRPDVPTGRELGVATEVEGLAPWFMMIAPQGTPADVVDTLGRHLKSALDLPDVQEALRGLGIEADYMDSAQAAQYFGTQRERIAKLVRDLDISIKS